MGGVRGTTIPAVMTSLRMRRWAGRRAGVAALAVAGVLALSSCGTAEAGSAAVVGDRRISVASVQSGYDSIFKLAGPEAGFTQSIILNYLILEPYLNEAAQGLGRGVSSHDALLEFQIDSSVPTPSPSAVKVMIALAANRQIHAGRSDQEANDTYAEISQQLKSDGVHINPRYGSGLDFAIGNDTTLTILPEQQNWIAQSTPEPTVSATVPGDTSQPEASPTP